MVSYEATKNKYHGRMSENYETKRKKQERWDLENEYVGRLIKECGQFATLLDCPVGTGRFLRLYEKMPGVCVSGVDSSKSMLTLAKRKKTSAGLRVGDATALEYEPLFFDVAVCVRFLDLIPQDTMEKVMRELARVTRRHIILTIRLGESYVPKSNTATHDEKRFRRLLRSLGLTVRHDLPIFKQGWRVMMLDRAP